MTVWIDVDNPPQAQYLAPFRAAFEAAGADVLITSRAVGVTAELLDARGEQHVPVGGPFGGGAAAKAVGTLRRAAALRRLLRRRGLPELLVSSSRSSALAAWRLRVPAFVVCDYEHAELGIYRRTGCTILHPSVIPADAFLRRGFAAERLFAFAGLKEDISLAAADPAGPGPELPEEPLVHVLFRPPASTSHYHRRASADLADDVLAALARNDAVRLVYSPRTRDDEGLLERHAWRHEPVVLRSPAAVLPLLRAVDVVVSGGGTMAREAAYVGTSAISIFRGAIGAVDRHLEQLGRLRLATDASALDGLNRGSLARQPPIVPNAALVHELAAALLARVRGAE